jgi:hypothetical protein
MKLPQFRFTMRRLMIAVAFLAVAIYLSIEALTRYFSGGYAVVYQVADLVDASAPAAQRASELSRFSSRLKSSIMPDSWWTRERTIVTYVPSNSLIIKHSAAGHRQIINWLRQQCKENWLRQQRSEKV